MRRTGSYVKPHTVETLKNHELIVIADHDKVKMWRLKDPNYSRIQGCVIVSNEEGLVIMGDLVPKRHGVISCYGYDWQWFAGKKSEDYLCEKFLQKVFRPDYAIQSFKEAVIRRRRSGWLTKERAADAWEWITDVYPDELQAHEFYSQYSRYFDDFCESAQGYDPRDASLLCAIQQKFSELMAKAQAEKQYYIVCTRHSFGGKVGFWGPNRCGYSCDLEHAGRYTAEEAQRIHTECEHIDFAVPCEVVEASAKRLTSVSYTEVDWKAQYAKPWAEVHGAQA